MGKVLVIGVSLCLVVLCTPCSQPFLVEVTIEGSHPWERASGRMFWYLLVYMDGTGLRQVTLPIGVRSIRIAVPRSQTIVCAAYPLGGGIPFGGALSCADREPEIILTARDGLLCDAMLQCAKRWPRPVGQVNFDRVRNSVALVDEHAVLVNFRRIITDVVSGNLEKDSFKPLEGRTVTLQDLPAGSWICEIPSLGSFTVYEVGEVVLHDLPRAMVRYLNLHARLELRIIVPDNAEDPPFSHMASLDTLLAIPDSVYHDLVRTADGYTEEE